jgi:putative NIF3 family GTP cyclohydrolase 1 type 2
MVAAVPGSGGGYLQEASRLGAQVLITGELRYHQMLEAEHLGMGVVELGHDRSEMPAVDLMAKAIRKSLARRAGTAAVHTYRRPGAAKVLAAPR